MPEQNASPVAVAPKATEKDVVDSQEALVDEVINDTGDDSVDTASDTTEESSTSEEADLVAEAVKAAEEDTSDDDVEQFMKPKDDGKKDNVQKRIDQLTAQIKELRNENSKLKAPEQNAQPKRYTDEQLKGALKKAFDEGDHELAWEVMKEQNKYAQEDLIKMYEGEKQKAMSGVQAINQEWNKVVRDYSQAWATDDGKELYQGASQELNVSNGNSLLYKLAMKFYHETVDEDGNPVYHTQGGQRMAVADALAAILKKRRIAPNELKTKKLERSLAKAKRKATTPATSSSDGELPRRAKSTGDTLADYMAERRKFRNERT